MKSFCIIGLGNFGKNLALTLAESGHQVGVIDTDPHEIDMIGDKVVLAVCGDATDESVLRSFGITNYDCCVVCLKSSMENSILITLMLKEMNIPKIIARANSELHRTVLTKIGADVVVFPEMDMGRKTAYAISRSNVIEHLDLSDKYAIIEIKTPKKWVDRSIKDLDIRKKYGLNVIAVCNNETKQYDIFTDPDRKFTSNEQVVIVGSNRDIDRLTRLDG